MSSTQTAQLRVPHKSLWDNTQLRHQHKQLSSGSRTSLSETTHSYVINTNSSAQAPAQVSLRQHTATSSTQTAQLRVPHKSLWDNTQLRHQHKQLSSGSRTSLSETTHSYVINTNSSAQAPAQVSLRQHTATSSTQTAQLRVPHKSLWDNT